MAGMDLHMHSRFSGDGELRPERLIELCAEYGIRVAAVTDHNSVRGVAEALDAGKRTGVRVLPGVELDCTFRGRSLHLLGYCFDHTRSEFSRIEEAVLRQEREAGGKKIALFQKTTGILLDTAQVLAAAGDGVVTGELIAEFVLAREDVFSYGFLHPYLPGGKKSDMPNVHFYWDFFSEGKPCYVPVRYLSLADAAALLHSAGGFTVLAHPGQNLDLKEEELLSGILAEGIDGIEVFSSYHDSNTAAHYLKIAEHRQLTVTCGSDFHGRQKPKITPGCHGAGEQEQALLAALEKHIGTHTGVS